MDGSSRAADPPGADLLAAMGRHLLLVLFCVLLLGAAGAAYGLLRHEEYKAETRVAIGQLNLSTQGVPGFVSAASALSSAYARTVDAPAVTGPAAAAAHVSVSAARDALTASSIPDTPLFRIDASTTDPQRSVALVNAASQAMIDYVLQINRRVNLREEVLAKYRRAAAKVSDIAVEQARAQAAFRRDGSAANRRALVAVGARAQVAALRRDSLKLVYSTAAGGELAENLLQIVGPADHATGDRTSVLERWILTGLLAGLVLGIALAAVRETGRTRRSAVAAP